MTTLPLTSAPAVEDLTPAQQLQILDGELTQWRQARYQAQLQARVARQLGDPPEQLEAIRLHLTRCERALDVLTQERAALVAPHVAGT